MTNRMPTIFVSHGSPMNALYQNEFTKALNHWSTQIPKPRAILAISAHWLTNGFTALQNTLEQRTIHDFGGFPKELFDIEYPAQGSPALAQQIMDTVADPKITPVSNWGLDHGIWAVLLHMYPDADIPVFQLSIDVSKPSEYHYQLGQKLAFLREQGVLILASGNVSHNLRYVDFNSDDSVASTAWASDLSTTVTAAIKGNDVQTLLKYRQLPGANYGIATPEHYFPLLYAAGAAVEHDSVDVIYDAFELGTLSMSCYQWN